MGISVFCISFVEINSNLLIWWPNAVHCHVLTALTLLQCYLHCHVLTTLALLQCDLHYHVLTALTLLECDVHCYLQPWPYLSVMLIAMYLGSWPCLSMAFIAIYIYIVISLLCTYSPDPASVWRSAGEEGHRTEGERGATDRDVWRHGADRTGPVEIRSGGRNI